MKIYFLDGLLILSCSPCVFVFPGAGCAHRRKRENTQSRLQPLITTPASAFNIYSIDFKRLSRGLVELLELCERESRKCKLKSVKEESLIMDPAKPAKKCPRREFKIWILQKHQQLPLQHLTTNSSSPSHFYLIRAQSWRVAQGLSCAIPFGSSKEDFL